MRFESDRIGLYRYQTKTMTPSPAATFKCSQCGKTKAILGRRKVGQDGNRVFYACVACQEDK